MPEVNCKQEVRNLIAENLNTDKGDKSDWRRFIHNKIKDYVLTSDLKCTLVTSSASSVENELLLTDKYNKKRKKFIHRCAYKAISLQSFTSSKSTYSP